MSPAHFSDGIPLRHTIPSHRVHGWCSHCPGRSVAEELAAWQVEAMTRIDEACPECGTSGACNGGACPLLTAEEAREQAAELGTELYKAQDTLAFVGESCDLADREQRTITTEDVRGWLKGVRCGRQLLGASAAEPESGCAHCGHPDHTWDDCATYTKLARDDAAAPPALTETERQLLGFALEMAEEEIHARSLEIPEKDRAALTSLRALADGAADGVQSSTTACACDFIDESWIRMQHADGCPAAPAAPDGPT